MCNILRNCLENKIPDIAKQWHPDKNINLTANDVTYGSKKIVWWLCSVCGCSYEMPIVDRVRQKRGCPFCSGRRTCEWNCLATKYPDIAKQWHPTLNGDLTPNDVPKSGAINVWWLCPDCHESYKKQIAERQKSGCPYCSGKRVCEWNCLAIKLPDIAKMWHPTLNGDMTPNDVTCGSNKMAWWLCKNCNENYNASICNITYGYGCPYCSGQKVCNWNCLATKHAEIAGQWHTIKNGKITPHDVVSGSRKKFWWKCSFCNKDIFISCGTATQRDKKYLICSKCNCFCQEEQIRSIIERLTGKKFPKTRKIPWLYNHLTKYKYEADGYCEELNIIFEHQGQQHCGVDGKYIRRTNDFFYQLYKDADKYKLCKENNCLLICTYYNQTEEEIKNYIRQMLMDNNVPIIERTVDHDPTTSTLAM